MKSIARSLAASDAPQQPLDRRRPTLLGDLRELFPHAPVFRRRAAGYDQFQVDTYVRWAEEELAAAAHQREELLLRHARLRADLDEARRLLCHTAGGRESLQLAQRLGSLLAAAADQADGMRADGEAARAQARAEGERLLADAAAEAERIRATAEAEAERRTVEAARAVAEAERTLAQAEQAATEARAEADARLAKVREIERVTAERAERIREAAAREAETARLQARDEVLRMLVGAREDRRRGEERRAALRAELAGLEQRVTEARVPVPVPAAVPRELPPTVLSGHRAGHLPHLGRRLRRS